MNVFLSTQPRIPSLGILIILVEFTHAGLHNFGSPLEIHHDHDQHASDATSFQHFHGPVEGPEYEVKVPHVEYHHDNHLQHDHGHQHKQHTHHPYTVDYVSHPKYSYAYGVKDHHHGNFHSQKETRDGEIWLMGLHLIFFKR